MLSIISDLNYFRKSFGGNFFRGFTTFLDNALTYWSGKKPWRGPLYVDWEINYACNARCSYCDSWKVPMEMGARGLSTEECIKIIRDLGEAGVWTLVFTGGEPLLRVDLELLVKEAKKHGMSVGINTNGSLLKKRAQSLIDAGVDSITVSVESEHAEVHDGIRGLKGLFNLLSDGIDEVAKLRKGNKPSLGVRMVINKGTFRDIEPYIEFWSRRVDSVVLQPIHDGLNKTIYLVPKGMEFDRNEKEEFEKIFEDLRKKYSWLNNLYYKEIGTFLFSQHDLYKKYKCFSGFFYLQISPTGDVYNCTAYMRKVGNVNVEGFEKVWHGTAMNDARKWLKSGRNPCTCHYTCTGPVNIQMTRIFGNKRDDAQKQGMPVHAVEETPHEPVPLAPIKLNMPKENSDV